MIRVARQGALLGDFPLGELNQRLAAGELLTSDIAWTEGMTAWVPLTSMPGITAPAAPLVPAYAVPLNPAPVSGLAVGSMVCGVMALLLICTPFLWFLFFFLPPFFSIPLALVAVLLGHTARSGIRRSGGSLQGAGMALAGLLTGYLTLAVSLLFAVVLLIFGIALFRAAAESRRTGASASTITIEQRAAEAVESPPAPAPDSRLLEPTGH